MKYLDQVIKIINVVSMILSAIFDQIHYLFCGVLVLHSTKLQSFRRIAIDLNFIDL